MVIPSYVNVHVVSARNLKSGLNSHCDALVVLSLADEKVQTSVKKKVITPVWNEQHQFKVPIGKLAILTLTVYNRGLLHDEFMGQLKFAIDQILPGASLCKFYPLKGKNAKKEDGKYRGELEVSIRKTLEPILPSHLFHKRGSLSNSASSQAISSLSNQKRLSMIQSQSVQSFGDIAQSSPSPKDKKKESSKFKKKPDVVLRRRDEFDGPRIKNRRCSLPAINPEHINRMQNQKISFLGSRRNNLVQSSQTFGSGRELQAIGERRESFGSNHSVNSLPETPYKSPDKTKNVFEFEAEHTKIQQYRRANSDMITTNYASENMKISEKYSLTENGEEKGVDMSGQYTGNAALSVVNVDLVYETLSKAELVDIIRQQRIQISRQQLRMRDLEDYIDGILVRVMETSPNILYHI